jgi:hypothetical protein
LPAGVAAAGRWVPVSALCACETWRASKALQLNAVWAEASRRVALVRLGRINRISRAWDDCCELLQPLLGIRTRAGCVVLPDFFVPHVSCFSLRAFY